MSPEQVIIEALDRTLRPGLDADDIAILDWIDREAERLAVERPGALLEAVLEYVATDAEGNANTQPPYRTWRPALEASGEPAHAPAVQICGDWKDAANSGGLVTPPTLAVDAAGQLWAHVCDDEAPQRAYTVEHLQTLPLVVIACEHEVFIMHRDDFARQV